MEAKITIYTGGTITGFSLPYDPVDRITQLQSDLAEAERILKEFADEGFVSARYYFKDKSKREKEEGNG